MKSLKVIKVEPKEADRLFMMVSVWKAEDGGEHFCPHSISRPKPVYVHNKQVGIICLHDRFLHKYSFLMTKEEVIEQGKKLLPEFRRMGLEKKSWVIEVPLPVNWQGYREVIKKIPA